MFAHSLRFLGRRWKQKLKYIASKCEAMEMRRNVSVLQVHDFTRLSTTSVIEWDPDLHENYAVRQVVVLSYVMYKAYKTSVG